MQLTPDIVEGMYELLRRTPPFRGWRMPEADALDITVFHNPYRFAGHYRWHKGRHELGVNGAWCGNISSLSRIVAHEMVHLHLQITHPDDKAHHGARFVAATKIVCRHHHLDPKAF